jgi:hypothetical protein
LLALGLALAGLDVPAALADPTPDQAIAELNAWRAQLGEGVVSSTSVSVWNTGCQHHNNYEQQHNTLTHFETDTNPANGFTADGSTAGPDSVLGEDISSPRPTPDAKLLPAPVWDGAIFHRVAVLEPRLAHVGYNATTFGAGNGPFTSWTCLWDQNTERPPYDGTTPAAIDNTRTTSSLTLYPSPANGSFDVPTRFPGGESPDPGTETGVNGATLGWLLSVEINGPWSDGGFGGLVWANGVTAILEPDGTTNTVPVVVSECGSLGCGYPCSGATCGTPVGGTALGPHLAGNFGIFPLRPLAANTTYRVSVSGTVTDNSGPSGPVSTPFSNFSWCFSTGPSYTPSSDCAASSTGAGLEPGVLPVELNASVSGRGSISGSGIACPGTCSSSYPPGSSLTLTAHPAAGQKFIGWSGGCSGSGPTCNLTITADTPLNARFAPILPPTLGGASLSLGRQLKLAFSVNAGINAPGIKGLVVNLPSGLSFSTKARNVSAGVKVSNHLRFTVGAHKSAMTISVAVTRGVHVTISSPEVQLSKALARSLLHHKVKHLAFSIKVTDAAGKTTLLRFTFSLH